MYFGDLEDANSRVRRLLDERRSHALLESAGTRPQIWYLV
jgi:Fe-S-cluster-containing dehydrogenase component